jgi:hypothetical protein
MLVVTAKPYAQNAVPPSFSRTDSAISTMELQFNGCYAEAVDIVLVWKRAVGNGKNPYKKLQSSH